METKRANLLNMKKITIKIRRYEPETQKVLIEKRTMTVDEDSTVLDLLNQINETEQASLSYRYSCRMSICGSCGAKVNGKPVLMCSTFCRDLPSEIVIEPLSSFPIIKDLVVDTDNAMDKMRDALPYTSFVSKKSTTPLKQTPEETEKMKQTSQCIKCMLCYSACPVYSLDNNFIGPAAAATADRYNNDPQDTLKEERMDSITSKNGVWDCSFIGECSVVCPKNVDPALAIQKLKVMGVFHSAKSALKPRKK